MAVTDVLRQSALFRGFTETGVLIFAGIARERTFAAGAALFVEDAVADAVYVIGDGRVRLTAKSPPGPDALLAEVGAGETLGAVSLVAPARRLCSATAATAVVAAEIRHQDFRGLLSQKPQACLKLLMNLVADLGQRVGDSRESLRGLIARR